ncbi:MAG: sulfite exporter TauE/SafE family protein [Wenzhouxiangellaceae bacterium]|nr:sulfite exporter TauE/SafE family protein [Wenzhouxiangellaceae bacterium]
MTPSAALAAGFLTGLFASPHCAAMCGGILAVLHGQVPRARNRLAAGFHAGRLASYLGLALVLAAAGAVPQRLAPDLLGPAARIALGGLLVLIAVYVAMPGRLRDRFGEFVRPLTDRLMPLFARLLPADTWPRAIGLGLLWGLLPCGLLYTVLAGALLLGDPAAAAALVAGFGMGTMPMLLGGGAAAAGLRVRLGKGRLRVPVAMVLALCGILVAAGPWLASAGHHHGLAPYVTGIVAGGAG